MSATTSPLKPSARPLVIPVPAGRRRRPREVAPALVAVGVACGVALLHWKGVDQAAQAYRVLQVRDHGLALWDSGWYGGNYPLGYSLVFPVVGALVGLSVAAAASAGLAAWGFDRLVTGALGRRPLGVWYFAASTVLPVSIGQLPFLAGEALGLGALVALRAERRVAAVALALLTASCSPLAAAFLVLAAVAWAWHDRGRRSWILVTAGSCGALVGGLGLLFPGTGPFPFPWGSLAFTLTVCAVLATSLLRSTPILRLAATMYAVASAASFLVANPVGGNAPRLAASIGVPLLVCLATAPAPAPLTTFTGLPSWADPGRWPLPRWWRPALTTCVLVTLAGWQWGPGLGVVTSAASDPAEAQSYYQPVVHQILARSRSPVRVEIPPTRQHWEAAWVAPYVSMARGWERQLDIADDPIFYQGGLLDASTYRHWLLANGVTWVALPATRLDYAGAGEAGLLRAGEVKGLHLVWSNRDWKLWRVTGTPGLVSGPATLGQLGPDQIRLALGHPGVVTLRIRYSTFWSVSGACLTPDAAGWTTVRASHAGPVILDASVLGGGSSACRPGT